MPNKLDKLFRNADAAFGSFQFDARVAEVFNDMIARSVPGYSQILSLLPTLTRQFYFAGCRYYDLGCSTCAGLAAIAQGLGCEPVKLVGIDNSQAMLDQAKPVADLISANSPHSLELICDDVTKVPLRNAAMVLMNFTLQFIALDQRDALIRQIYQALIPGGVLVLSEKLVSPSQDIEKLMTRIHHQFKADQGYSKLEISQKREAIENVLIPEALLDHHERLLSAGFTTITPWIRNLQFVSILAVKDA